MSPYLPAIIAMAPELAPYVFGPAAEPTLAAAEQAVRTATGADTPEAAQSVLARDAQAVTGLRVDLARIAAGARRAEDVSGAAWRPGGDVPGGRAASAAWIPALVSLVVLLAFAGAVCAALTRTLPQGSETVATLLLGTLASLATSVVSYWVGSSAGSAAKTDLLFGGRSPPAAGPAPTPGAIPLGVQPSSPA